MSVDQKRALISQPSKLSIKCRCALLELHRSMHYYSPQEPKDNETDVMNLIADIYAQRPQYGYRKVTVVLKGKGERVQDKFQEGEEANEADGATLPSPQTTHVDPKQTKNLPFILIC